MTESLQAEYASMLVRLKRARDRDGRLRALAEQAAAQVDADERLVRSLAELLGHSAQATIEDLSQGLKGHRLREVAVEILGRHHVPGDVIHYRDWFELVRGEGLSVAGKDPLATFLAQISRSDAVEAIGGRTGKYRLVAAA